MSKIVPFVAEHLDLFEMRESEEERLALDPAAVRKMQALAQHGMGGTLLHDGRILGILGYYEMWPGVYEVWAFPSIYVEQYATVYLMAAKKLVQQVERSFSPHRLQSMAIADDLHDGWMRFLGFTVEAPEVKHYFVNKQSARLWARTYDDRNRSDDPGPGDES